MQVTQVTFMKRRNLGNYEHIESSATVSLLDGDSSDVAIEKAKEVVGAALGIKPTARKVVTETTTNAPVKEEEAPKKKVAKKTTKKKVVVTKEEVTNALRGYAKAKKSKEMAFAVMEDVTGAKKLDEVEEKFYGKLVKALEVK